MKLAFIVCYEHVKPSLMDMLRALRIDYYTHWEQIKGKGHGTEPHLGTGTYASTNSVTMIAFEDEAALEALIATVTEANKGIPRQADRIRLFQMPLDRIV